MKMASNDAAPSNDGAAGLVPEINTETLPLEPVAGAAIAAPVTGQNNIIDPWIRNNFVQAPNGEFTVSPRNSPGEILMNLELGPDLNPYLAHLSRMYNGYAGGVEVQVLLAGNAFTAGKILFAAVPPNFPVDMLSPAQITMLPHLIVDVRTLEPIMIPLPDVRNVFYHFNNQPAPRMRLVAMLYTPLRSNGSGDDVFTVSCRVLTRPTPDFEFTYLVPPSVESKTKPFTLPILTIGELTNSRFPAPIDQLYTSPNADVVVQPQNGRCTLDGELQGTTQLLTTAICSYRGTTSNPTSDYWDDHLLHLVHPNGATYDPTEDVPAPFGTQDFRGILYGVLTQNTQNPRDEVSNSRGIYISSTSDKFTPKLGTIGLHQVQGDTASNQQSKFTPVGIAVNQNTPFKQWELPNYSGALTLNTNLAPAVGPNFPGEQILFFRSNVPSVQGNHPTQEIDCLIPQEWVSHFYQESAPSQSDVALVRYVNPDTGRTTFEAKLHRQGFITIAATGSNPVVVPPNGYFRFDSWVNQFYALAPMGTGNGRRRAQ
uniref:Viral protein 1 n=1 Tax=Norovirus Hu/GII.21/CUHK-NS-609/HKG/2015 TaxID=1760939 RepID=A0A0S2T0M4_NORV|nr:viral protein 1 [Norovirus Hu/GII.21/CUHK-NS-609/HKG/2015]